MATSVLRSPLLARLRELRVGPYAIGAQLESVGSQLISWVGSSALSAGRHGHPPRHPAHHRLLRAVLPAASRPQGAWRGVRPFIPFSAENAEVLRVRFRDVTFSTLVGTGLTAAVQGLLVALAFWATGLSNAAVLGRGDVHRSRSCRWWGAGWSGGRARPRSRWTGTTAGASGSRSGASWWWATWTASSGRSSSAGGRGSIPSSPSSAPSPGIRWFGLLGLLIGPLAISYFFELIRMYRAEYLRADGRPAGGHV